VSPPAQSSEALIAKVGRVVDQIGPVLQKAGPALDKATQTLATTQRILEDARPRIAEIAAETAAIVKPEFRNLNIDRPPGHRFRRVE
jgi:ABC-type transporter Mla subunit MlaD